MLTGNIDRIEIVLVAGVARTNQVHLVAHHLAVGVWLSVEDPCASHFPFVT